MLFRENPYTSDLQTCSPEYICLIQAKKERKRFLKDVKAFLKLKSCISGFTIIRE